jgi:hypothetical protein
VRLPLVQVRVVDATKIRDRTDADFIGGGHWLVYDYIPRPQVWIERGFGNEGRFLLAHELVEVCQMHYLGQSYRKGHRWANLAEGSLRKVYLAEHRPHPARVEATLRPFLPPQAFGHCPAFARAIFDWCES